MKKSSNIFIEQVLIPENETFFFRHDNLCAEDELGYHSHPEFEIECVVHGSGVHVIGGVSRPCAEGEIVLIPGNMPHAWFWDEKLYAHERIEEYTLQFNFQTINNQLCTIPEMRACLRFLCDLHCAVELHGDEAEQARSLCELIGKQGRARRIIAFYELLLLFTDSQAVSTLVCGESTKVGRYPHRMDAVYKFMLENYTRSVSLDEIAGIACMNRSAFCTFFRRITGKTFATMMNEYRINRACQLLGMQTESDIHSISCAVGFNDISHFNRLFLRLKGCSPSTYKFRLKSLPQATIIRRKE